MVLSMLKGIDKIVFSYYSSSQSKGIFVFCSIKDVLVFIARYDVLFKDLHKKCYFFSPICIQEQNNYPNN